MSVLRTQRPLVIDTDPGPDDALALWLALASPELGVRAVCTVAGNVGLDETTRNACAVISLAQRRTPVYPGADRPLAGPPLEASRVHGVDGVGGVTLPPPRIEAESTSACAALLALPRVPGSALTLAGLGPVTNLALAVALDPGLRACVADIVLMGGAVSAGIISPRAEFNAGADPEALAILLAGAGPPVTFATLDLTAQATLTESDIAHLAARGEGHCLHAAASLLRAIRPGPDGGRPVHDACAIAYLVRPDLFTSRPCHARVVLDGPERGLTIFEPHTAEAPPNARLLETIDRAGFLDLLGERLASLP